MRNPRLPIYILVLIYMPALSVLAWIQGNQEFLFYALTMLVIIAGVYALDRRVHFSLGVLWLLCVWGLIHMAGGTVPAPTGEEGRVLYAWRPIDWLPKYDQVVHTYGFFAATFAAHECVRAAVTQGKPMRVSVGLAIALALIGMGLGALNEVVEFTATLIFEETGVGGYVNTGWDMVCNMAGASLAAAIIWARRHAPAQEKGAEGDPAPAP